MRAILGVVLAIAMLFVLVTAMGTIGGQTEDTAVTNGTAESADAWNFTTDISTGLGQVFSPAIVWMGIGAIVIVAGGLLLSAGRSGR